ncbi:MAG: hypothetical protein AAF591_14025 [Verrucomicrobiota bacterium]
MNLFKRVEVWVLVAFIIAGLAYVLISEQQKNNDTSPPPTSPSAFNKPESNTATTANDPSTTPQKETQSFTLKKIHLKRDYENAIIELDLVIHNEHGQEYQLIPPYAQLLAAPPDTPANNTPPKNQLRPIEPFFLAFAAPPVIPAGQKTAPAQLKYWLEPTDLAGPLWLQIQNQSQLVKSASSFNLNTIKNQQSKSFTPPIP